MNRKGKERLQGRSEKDRRSRTRKIKELEGKEEVQGKRRRIGPCRTPRDSLHRISCCFSSVSADSLFVGESDRGGVSVGCGSGQYSSPTSPPLVLYPPL